MTGDQLCAATGYSGFVIAPPFHNIHCPGKLVFGLLFYPTDALL